MSPRKADIIDQLRKAIRDSGESQRSIAMTVGIDQPNLNSFVKGKRSISFETAAKLCQYLRLSLR